MSHEQPAIIREAAGWEALAVMPEVQAVISHRYESHGWDNVLCTFQNALRCVALLTLLKDLACH